MYDVPLSVAFALLVGMPEKPVPVIVGDVALTEVEKLRLKLAVTLAEFDGVPLIDEVTLAVTGAE